MESLEECLLKYRGTLRQLLYQAGVSSNPGVTDDWILDEISKLIPTKISLSTSTEPSKAVLKLVGIKYIWNEETARQKILRTQEILGLSSKDAIDFLLMARVSRIICDGCNVRSPWEHRCHGRRSVVYGEQTGKHCECPDCFVANELGPH